MKTVSEGWLTASASNNSFKLLPDKNGYIPIEMRYKSRISVPGPWTAGSHMTVGFRDKGGKEKLQTLDI